MLTSGVELNAETHTYRLDGSPVPGCTAILEAIFPRHDGVASDDLIRRRDIGLAVHAATHYYDDGTLEPASVHEAVRPGLDAWIEWRTVTGFVPLQIEALVASRRYRFAGTLDRLGYFSGCPEILALVDLKAVRRLSPVTALQTAGYSIAAAETFGRAPARRFAVQLRDNGKPFSKEYTDHNDRNAFLAVASAAAWGWNSGMLRGGF